MSDLVIANERARKNKSYKGEVGKVAANILNLQFDVQEPFEKLVGDIFFCTYDDQPPLSGTVKKLERISFNRCLYERIMDLVDIKFSAVPGEFDTAWAHHLSGIIYGGNFKSLQKWQKILVAICKWSVFGLSSIASAKEDGSHAQTTISNSSTIFFSAKFCRTFEITSISAGIFRGRHQSFSGTDGRSNCCRKNLSCLRFRRFRVPDSVTG